MTHNDDGDGGGDKVDEVDFPTSQLSGPFSPLVLPHSAASNP